MDLVIFCDWLSLELRDYLSNIVSLQLSYIFLPTSFHSVLIRKVETALSCRPSCLVSSQWGVLISHKLLCSAVGGYIDWQAVTDTFHSAYRSWWPFPTFLLLFSSFWFLEGIWYINNNFHGCFGQKKVDFSDSFPLSPSDSEFHILWPIALI